MSDTRDDFVISFKPHTGYDAPLIAVRGSTVADVLDKLRGFHAAGGFAVVGQIDAAVKAGHAAGSVLGATPVDAPPADTALAVPPQEAQPAAPATPPVTPPTTPYGKETKTCGHGTKVYRTSKPNAAKKWGGWFCPSPKGTPDQCPVEWDNDYGK